MFSKLIAKRGFKFKKEIFIESRFLLLLGFGRSHLKSFMFIILSYEARYLRRTVHKVHPLIIRITAHATIPGGHF